MRNAMILVAVLIGFLGLAMPADSQCNPANVTLSGPAGVPIGQTLVLNYATPRHFNGRYLHSFVGFMPGQTPLGNGFCLALQSPFYYLGSSVCAASKSTFNYAVPNASGLIGAKLYFAAFTADAQPAYNGASNNHMCTIWEDWPLP